MASACFVTLLKLIVARSISRTTNSKTFRNVVVLIEVNIVVSPLVKSICGTDDISTFVSKDIREDK